MAGNRSSLNFQFANELRELIQKATVRLEELNFLDPAEAGRVSAAVTAAVNREPACCVVGCDVDARVVRVDLAALTDRIGDAFTSAGVCPEFLKPVYRAEGLGWYRHMGWRMAMNSDIARSLYDPRCPFGGVVSE